MLIKVLLTISVALFLTIEWFYLIKFISILFLGCILYGSAFAVFLVCHVNSINIIFQVLLSGSKIPTILLDT